MNITGGSYWPVRTNLRRLSSEILNPGAWKLNTLLAALVFLAAPWPAAAQSTAKPRVSARVDDRVLTVLHGNVHPLARQQNDQGAVPDSQPVHRMLLALKRGPDQEAALKQLMDEQQSKSSTNYHQWLTPQQFGQQFGPADADVQAVTSWLQSHGFQVAKVSNGRTIVEFSGTAGQVRDAFHTEIHKYLVNGVQRFANNADPQIPTELAPVVAGPVSLHNFPKKPQSRIAGTFRKTKATGQVAPLNTQLSPHYTFSSLNYCGQSSCNAVSPGDFDTIYNVLPLWNPGINSHAIDGTGQTIAIVGDSEICTVNMPAADFTDPNQCNSNDDVAQFRSLFGLPANSPNVIIDGPDPYLNSDETEGDLDVEWSGAVAKNAAIDYVIAEDTESTFGTDLAAEYIVDNNLAPVLSESYGACELALGSVGNLFEATLWQQAAAEGITVVVSAGDSGSAGCDDPDTQGVAQYYGPAVNGIASTPFNVAAGGTDFDINASNYPSNYWNQNTNSTTGGNTYDGLGYASALSYIPETTWNDSCAQSLTSPGTCTPTNGGIVAGGGGQSNCPFEDQYGYCYYYAKPSWQTTASGSDLSPGNDLTRDLPDISLFAADGYISNSFYIICEADISGGPCNLSTPFFDFVGVGGTSSAAPTFAGMMALVNQNMAVNHPALSDPILGARQGNANYSLYGLASSQNPSNCNSSTGSNSACIFNDITKGNNSVPCVAVYEFYEGYAYIDDPGCSNETQGGYGVEEAFDLNSGNLTGDLAWTTAVGLDLATGLGSVNAFNLVNKWATTPTFTPTTTSLCLSTTATSSPSCSAPISVPHGTTVYVNTQVNAGGGAIPVSETVGNANSGADPFAPNKIEDVTLLATSGATPVPANQFTSNSYAIPSAVSSSSDFFPTYPLTNGTTVNQNYATQYLPGGTYSVVAHYTSDGTYGGSDSSPISVTVTPEGTTLDQCVFVVNPTTGPVFANSTTQEGVSLLPYACVPGSSSMYGDLVTIREDVFGVTSGQENAKGNVTLTDNSGPVANPVGGTTSAYKLNTEGYTEDQTSYLAVGTHSFQAIYNGVDPSYTAGSATATTTFTIAQAPTVTTISASTTMEASNDNVTLTALVDTQSVSNPSGGSTGLAPSGTVTFYNNSVAIGSISGNNLIPVIDSSQIYIAAQANLATKLSASGTITAVYSGDTNYTGSTTSTGVTVTLEPPLSVTTTNSQLPAGVVDETYPATNLAAAGGTGSGYSWSVASAANTFPPGLALSPTGAITGTPSPSSSGKYTFIVQVTDSASNMNVANLSITITAVSPIGSLDAAVNAGNGTTTIMEGGSLQASGWAVDPVLGASGVSQVQVLIDGVALGNATLGLSRPDVATAYGKSSYTNSGWTFTGSIGSLTAGSHTVSAKILDSSGASATVGTANITVTAVPPIGSLDAAVNAGNGTTTIAEGGSLQASGWAVDPVLGASGVSQVQVLIDGVALGNATLGQSRPDVATAYGKSSYTNSGWTFTGSIGSLTAGSHTVSAKILDSSGASATVGTANITVTAVPPIGSLDAAVNAGNGTTTIPQGGSLQASGWAVDPVLGASGVSQVQVLIDGVALGNATLGLSRPDVATAYGKSSYTNSGWTYTGSIGSLSAGSHTVSAMILDSSGASATVSTAKITVTAVPPIGSLDAAVNAANGTTTIPQGGSLQASGWAVDPVLGASGVSQVQVLIDGVALGNATLGQSRPDVATAYGKSSYTNSGWTFTGGIGSLTAGSHTVSAMILDSSGASATVGTSKITVTAVPPIGSLDAAVNAANGTTTIPQGGSLQASGWAVDPVLGATGVSQVQVLIDGVALGNATLGQSRPDVATAYGKSSYTNSGWTFTGSIGSLSAGSHTVSAVALDSSGASATVGTLNVTVGTSGP